MLEESERFIEESVQQNVCPVCGDKLCQKFNFPICENRSCPAHPSYNGIGNTEREISIFTKLNQTIKKR